MRFERGRWYNVRVRVDEDRIRAWIDECLVIDLNTKGRSLDIRQDVANSRPLGIAAWNTIASLRNIRIRRLDP